MAMDRSREDHVEEFLVAILRWLVPQQDFLLRFLMLPSSTVSLWRLGNSSPKSALNPGTGSIRMTAGGPSSGRKGMHRRISASRRARLRSSSRRREVA